MAETTTDYTKFKFLIDNRQTARTHINKLKEAITRKPEILEVQPILVNEKYEIIDGQHRFVAASELGLPITYNMVHGIGIETAREMNVLQRGWTLDDYAISYAKAGNLQYKAFNKYRREHPGISGTVLITIMSGKEIGNLSSDFRNGKFVIKRDTEDTEWILKELEEIKEITGHEIPLTKPFVTALLTSIENEEFVYAEFKKNLRRKPDMFRRTPVIRDGLRLIEDLYNYQKSTNTIRLY